jgi:uncharacterized protein YgbK (DUF1537 family)
MKIKYSDIISNQPAEYAGEIFQHEYASGRTIVILDDDPTGCQTVKDVPLLLKWNKDSLRRMFMEETPLFFILTNSRSYTGEEACKLISEILLDLKHASEFTKRKFLVISRSDSTLRGHYPLETDTIINSLNFSNPLQCLIPAFFQGGRYTVNNIHYVKENEFLIPAGETQYARDPSFGFKSSNLTEYIEEKNSGNITASDVLSFSLREIRTSGPEFIAETLLSTNKKVCVVDALSQKDLDVFAAGAWRAIESGKTMLFRTAASFINSFAGLPVPELLNRESISINHGTGALYVVGSFVKKSTDQLNFLAEREKFIPFELKINDILNEKHLMNISRSISKQLAKGYHCVLFTERRLKSGNSAEVSLRIGKNISIALVKIIKNIETVPGWLLSKGGITSHVLAKEAIGIQNANVMGQILPGVPVIKTNTGKYSGMPFIIFPGNVGDKGSLLEIHQKLK